MSGGDDQGFMGDVDPNERRIVLVGKTGVGKSAVGNTILGREAFKSALSPTSLTTDCKKVKGSVAGRPVAVIDTPGLFDTSLKQEEVLSRITNCISLSCPGPHVFLVVLRLGRLTQEEKEAVNVIQNTFGEDAARYTMVVFTHGDLLKNQTIKGFISKNPDLEAFIQSCSGRYHVFNNEVKDLTQTSQLLDKINRMTTANGGSFYSNDMFKRAEAAIKEKKELQAKVSQEASRRIDAEKSNDFLSKTIIGLTTGSGATTGAALGTFGGPVGVVVGGTIGAVVGIFSGFITSAASKK